MSAFRQRPAVALPDVVAVSFAGLRFDDAALERAYLDELRTMPRWHVRQYLLSIAIWGLVAPLDYALWPVLWPPFAPYRAGAALVLSAAVFMLTRAHAKRRWMAISAGANLALLCTVLAFVATRDPATELTFQLLALSVMSIIMVYTAAGFHLSPGYAMVVVVPAVLATAVVCFVCVSPEHPAVAAAIAAYIATGGAAALVAVVYAEMERRRRFLAELQVAWAQYDSDQLLLNVLPASVAGKLKEGGPVSERFDDVTVVFADIVGFTPLAASMDPDDLLSLLDEIFQRFDEAAQRHGVEKIKTSGDAYMAVAGAPERTADHAARAASFALALPAIIEAVDAPAGAELSIRVGMNSGPVSGGVVGKKRLAFDLWGDTVNIASRMESHGAAGEVRCSAATASQLPPAFSATSLGDVQLKGRGPMEVFRLVGPG